MALTERGCAPRKSSVIIQRWGSGALANSKSAKAKLALSLANQVTGNGWWLPLAEKRRVNSTRYIKKKGLQKQDMRH